MLTELNAYNEYCKEIDDFTDHSLNAYTKVLSKLSVFLGAGTDVKSIRKQHLQAYIDSLPNTMAASTSNHHIYIIRAFFKFLLEFDYIEGDVSSVLKTKADELKIKVELISEGTFLKLCNFELEFVNDCRDLAILYLMYNTGALPGEICSLKLKDYDEVNKQITYHRGSGTRTLDLDAGTVNTLDKYISAKHVIPSGEYLFESKFNNPIMNRTLFNIIKKRVKDARIKQCIGSMMFRYSYANRKLSEGIYIRELQHLLGHTHTYLTQRFMFILEKNN